MKKSELRQIIKEEINNIFLLLDQSRLEQSKQILIDADPFSQASNIGNWVKSYKFIKPEQIKTSTIVDVPTIKRLIQQQK